MRSFTLIDSSFEGELILQHSFCDIADSDSAPPKQWRATRIFPFSPNTNVILQPLLRKLERHKSKAGMEIVSGPTNTPAKFLPGKHHGIPASSNATGFSQIAGRQHGGSPSKASSADKSNYLDSRSGDRVAAIETANLRSKYA